MADEKQAPSLAELNRHLFASMLPATHGEPKPAQDEPKGRKGKKAEAAEQQPDTAADQG